MVPQYDGYWYYYGQNRPTKGKAGDHGAPLPIDITFNIANPNPYPVLLEDTRSPLPLKDFELVTVNSYDT